MFWIAISILVAALVLLIFGHDSGRVAGIDAEAFSRLAAGAALVLVIGAGLVFSYRGRIGTAFRHAIVWLLVGLLAIAAFAFRDEAAYLAERIWAELSPGYGIEQRTGEGSAEVLIRRRADGHFAADVTVNGRRIRMLVDTGASVLTLSDEDARRAGIDPARLTFAAEIETANGRTRMAEAMLDSVAIGSIEFGRTRAFVARPDQLNESLLGIGILSRLESYEVRGDSLILRARRR